MKNLKNPPACMIYQILWCTGHTKTVLAKGSQITTDMFSVPLIADWQGREKQCLDCCHRQYVQEDQRPPQTGEHLGKWKGRKRSWGILFKIAVFSLCILKIRFFFSILKMYWRQLHYSTEYLHTSFQNSGRKPCQMILAEYIFVHGKTLYVCMSKYICCRYISVMYSGHQDLFNFQ